MFKRIILILIALSLSTTALSKMKWPGLPPDCWEKSRIVHNIDNWKMLEEKLDIKRVELKEPIKFDNMSPNNGYSFKKEGNRPNVTITIYAEQDYLTVLTINDIYGVSDTKWINEKLLFIRIWWGRIAMDDIIFDVETENIIYTEPATDGFQAYQQYKDGCKRHGGCKCIEKKEPVDN